MKIIIAVVVGLIYGIFIAALVAAMTKPVKALIWGILAGVGVTLVMLILEPLEKWLKKSKTEKRDNR